MTSGRPYGGNSGLHLETFFYILDHFDLYGVAAGMRGWGRVGNARSGGGSGLTLVIFWVDGGITWALIYCRGGICFYV